MSTPTHYTQGFHHLNPGPVARSRGQGFSIPGDFPPSDVLVKSPDDPKDLTTYIIALMPYVLFEKWREDEVFQNSGYCPLSTDLFD